MEIKYEQTGSPWVLLTEEQAEAWKRGESITIQPPKPKQWEPRGGAFAINGMFTIDDCGTELSEYTFAGMSRATQKQAEAAAAQIRQYARLLAYRDEFAPGYVVPPIGENAWSILCRDGKFWSVVQSDSRDLLAVYMPEDVIKDLAYGLNSGEVVL